MLSLENFLEPWHLNPGEGLFYRDSKVGAFKGFPSYYYRRIEIRKILILRIPI